MAFDVFMTDKVTFTKKDGSFVKSDIKASVQTKGIMLSDTELPIEAGDHFLRQLPNGLVEDYVVIDPIFHSGFATIKAHWDVKVRRTNEPPATPQKIINNITGHNARINIGSTDNSTNTVNENSEKLFADLSAALVKGIADRSERDRLLQVVYEMKQGQQAGTFKESYQKFISSAAEHITVIAPFLPALSAML